MSTADRTFCIHSNVVSMAPDMALQPQFMPTTIDNDRGYLMNADAVILLAKMTDTDAARQIYKDYRRTKARLKKANPGVDDATLRQTAIMTVLPIFYSA